MGILFHFEVKMAVNNGAFLPFLVLSTILVLFSNQYRTTAIDEKGKPLITSTCNSTDFPNDCVTFLESDPRTSTVDLTGLSRIALELTATKASDGLKESALLVQNAANYYDWGFKVVCFDEYSNSVPLLKNESLQYFDQKNYNKTFEILDGVNKATLRCNESLSRINEVGLFANNSNIWMLTSITKAILNLLF